MSLPNRPHHQRASEEAIHAARHMLHGRARSGAEVMAEHVARRATRDRGSSRVVGDGIRHEVDATGKPRNAGLGRFWRRPAVAAVGLGAQRGAGSRPLRGGFREFAGHVDVAH